MQRVLIFILLINSIVFSQKFSKREIPNQTYSSDVLFDIHQLNSDSSNIFFSCRIPFDKAYFVKTNSSYLSNVKVNLEVRDSSQNVYRRETISTSANTETFEATNAKDKFIEVVFKLNLSEGKYSLLPSIEYSNSFRVSNYPGIDFSIDTNKLFYKPIIASPVEDTKSDTIQISNYGGNLPFTNSSPLMLIPISGKVDFPVSISIEQNDKIIFHTEVKKNSGFFLPNISNGNLELTKYSGGIDFIIVNNFNKKLTEGITTIEISNSKSKKIFEMNVFWFNKPFSLRDSEEAIKLLRIIEKDDDVDKILDQDDEKYQALLFDYWQKYDPDTSNLFNEVMEEFYIRVDKADKSYSIFDKRKGSATDRGKIFIKYGTPDQIIRNFKQIDSTTETWIYKSMNLQFKFSDNSGTGNFVLQK